MPRWMSGIAKKDSRITQIIIARDAFDEIYSLPEVECLDSYSPLSALIREAIMHDS